MSAEKTAITPTRAQDFPEWYQQVVRAADLAENSETRGCMVIKPWGYAIWELIQRRTRRPLQGDRPPERLFPAADPALVPGKGGRARRGFRHRVRGGHPSPAGDGQGPGHRQDEDGPHRRIGRAVRDPPHLRNDHRRRLRAVDPVLPRPAPADQPVGERDALGNAPAVVPAHRRVPVAGRPHRPRDARRGAGRGAHDPPTLRRIPARFTSPSRWFPAKRPKTSASPAPTSP